MEKLFTILCFLLPVLFCSCKEDADPLAEQQTKIVTYLTSTHLPKLVAEENLETDSQLPYYTRVGDGAYRYIDGVYNPDRVNWTEVTSSSMVTITFSSYIFTYANIATTGTQIAMPFYSNDPQLEQAFYEAGLTPGAWPFEPLKIDMSKTSILKGLYLALLGSRQNDVVEVYMSYNMAYGDTHLGVIPRESPIAYFFTVDNVE
ncbi:MAG: hypothetical protein RR270_03035 [Alistipes sp.]